MYNLIVGHLFDHRYTLTERIGVGATGEVWLARDGQIPRDVALKVMNTILTAHSLHLERFQREINSLNELGNSHPNIPQLYGANTISERPYIVMEYIGGTSLKNLIDTQFIHQIPFTKRVTHIIQHIADALSYAHDRDIVHRDIKPENVKIMGEADRTYLLDFSIAVLNAAETHSGVGTPKYIAPEVSSNTAADIFSFGLVCYEILLGRHPIYEYDEVVRGPYQAQQILQERIGANKWQLPSQAAQNLIGLPNDIDWEKIDVVFRQVLSLDPTERPTHAQALAAGLIAAINTESTSELVLSELRTERLSKHTHDELGALLDSSQHTQLESPIAASDIPLKHSFLQTYVTSQFRDPLFLAWGMIMVLIGIIIGAVLN